MKEDQAMAIILAMIQAKAIVPRHLMAYQKFLKAEISGVFYNDSHKAAVASYLKEQGVQAAAYLDSLPIVALYNELINPKLGDESQKLAVEHFSSSLKKLGIESDKEQ